MLWVFVGQIALVAALFAWSDVFPQWLSCVIVTAVIVVSPLAYLTVLLKPAMRQAWREILQDCWMMTRDIVMAFIHLFRPATAMKLVRVVTSLKPVPTTVDGWITLLALPFKTCIVTVFPLIWLFERIASHSSYFRPYGRTFGLSYELLFECYLVSLMGLLFGALLQGIFCRAGRATVTLRFFLLGIVLLFILTSIPR